MSTDKQVNTLQLIYNLETILHAMAERCGLLSTGVEVFAGRESVGLAGAGIDIVLEGGEDGGKPQLVVFESYDVETEGDEATPNPAANPAAASARGVKASLDVEMPVEAPAEAPEGGTRDGGVDGRKTRHERIEIQRFNVDEALHAVQMAILQAVKRRTEMAVDAIPEDVAALGRLISATL